jgi:outer membrane lipoprotein LolB
MPRCLNLKQESRLLRGALFFFVLFNLPACTTLKTTPQQVDPQAWQQRQQILAQLDVWSFNGRVAVRDNNDEAWNASLRWHQTGESYDIQLAGAFGQGAARLHGNGGHAVMEMAGQAPLMAADPEALMHDRLGWYVPVRGLKYWLTGLPEPGQTAAHEFDVQGRLSRLQQGQVAD